MAMVETSFFAGSENLYKYLVSIGMLLIVLTVYYPLKEKQELEISKIALEGELKSLNYQIKNNQDKVQTLQSEVGKNGVDIQGQESLVAITKINCDNHIKHIECEQKYAEINARQNHIKQYNILFWIFLPLGCVITIFGFVCWHKVKKDDDKIVKLNAEKLQIEVDRLKSK